MKTTVVGGGVFITARPRDDTGVEIRQEIAIKPALIASNTLKKEEKTRKACGFLRNCTQTSTPWRIQESPLERNVEKKTRKRRSEMSGEGLHTYMQTSIIHQPDNLPELPTEKEGAMSKLQRPNTEHSVRVIHSAAVSLCVIPVFLVCRGE